MTDKILVVDDEPLIRLGLVGLMEESGFEVLDAGNADAALALFAANPDIRLVISDVDMPGSMDGLGLVHQVRSRSQRTGIVVISGKVGLDGPSMPSGARFFSKPYGNFELTRTVRLLLADEAGEA